jgi:hypothetical protein
MGRHFAAAGFEVLVVCSAIGFLHRTFAQSSSNSTPTWLAAKQNYRVSPLSSQDMTKFAQLSNPSHFRRLLSPLLAPRISGTLANKKVQLVCSEF